MNEPTVPARPRFAPDDFRSGEDDVTTAEQETARHSALDPAPHAGSTRTDVDLGSDPFDDDLADRLKTRAPLKITKVTLGLAAGVLLVGGFLGGVLVQQHFGVQPTVASNAASRFGGGAGGAGGGGGGGFFTGGGTGTGTGSGRGATTGTVTLVDGTTLYITTAAGDTIIVKTGTNTTVASQKSVALKDLPVGSTVTVVGTTGSDGSITATQVTSTGN
jgi:hypothetical protein